MFTRGFRNGSSCGQGRIGFFDQKNGYFSLYLPCGAKTAAEPLFCLHTVRRYDGARKAYGDSAFGHA